MSKPALKWQNNCAILKQNYTLKLFVAFKMAYSCYLSLGEIAIFQNSSKKSFKTSTTELSKSWKHFWQGHLLNGPLYAFQLYTRGHGLNGKQCRCITFANKNNDNSLTNCVLITIRIPRTYIFLKLIKMRIN